MSFVHYHPLNLWPNHSTERFQSCDRQTFPIVCFYFPRIEMFPTIDLKFVIDLFSVLFQFCSIWMSLASMSLLTSFLMWKTSCSIVSTFSWMATMEVRNLAVLDEHDLQNQWIASLYSLLSKFLSQFLHCHFFHHNEFVMNLSHSVRL